MLTSDQAVLIDLETLEPHAVQSLMTELQLPGLERLSPAMSRYTGGNPMFVLETLKHLIETDSLEQDFPEHLPPPGRIGPLVRQRLELLSAVALRLARVAAIAGTDFTLELGAKVLETGALDLTEPLFELEQAQVMKGERFAHDLIFEATLEGVPIAIKTLVHKRCAEYLEVIKGEPARIAHHWLEAGDEQKAVPWLLEVQNVMMQNGLLQESAELLEQAAKYSASVKDHLMIQATLAERYAGLSKLKEAEQLIEQVIQSPGNPLASAIAFRVLAEIRCEQGQYEKALALIERGIPLAALTEDTTTIDALQAMIANIAYRQQRYTDAVDILEPLLERYKNTATSANYLSIALNLSVNYQALKRYSESKALNKESLQIAQQIQSHLHLVLATSNYLFDAINQGHPEDGIEGAEEALKLGNYTVSLTLRTNLAHAYFRLRRNEDSIKHYLVLLERGTSLLQCIAWANLAVLYDRIGQKEESAIALEKAIEMLPDNSHWAARYAVIRAVLTIGSTEQFSKVEPYSLELNLSSLSETFQREFEELLTARKNSLVQSK